ncbi:MAG: sugar phosphate isomerase/epimerase family protein [Candidatus Bathyarchaeia archaeon]
MKVCVTTDEISRDPETALGIATDWGIRHFELRYLFDRRVPDTQPFTQERLRNLFTQYHADVVAIFPWLFKFGIEDTSNIYNHLSDRLPRSIELAKDLGTNLIIIFGFIGDAKKYDEYFDLAVSYLSKAADHAADRNILLAIENEPICLADTGERTARLVEAVNRDNLLINWDLGNAYVVGEKPSVGYSHVKDFLAHIHLKDCIVDNKTGKAKFVPLNKGKTELFEQLEKVKANAYDGFVSIETHFTPKVKGTRQCWKNLKAFLRKSGENIE